MDKEVDYYGLLNLNPSCTFKDINRAFHRLVLKYHPDQHGSDGEQFFREIAEAYDVLRDPQRRAVYDQYGIKGLREGVPGPTEYIQPYRYHGDAMRTYREFFGTDNPFTGLVDVGIDPKPIYRTPELCGYKRKEDTIVRTLPLTLKEVFYGGVKKMKVTKFVLLEDELSRELQEEVLTVPIQRGIPPGTDLWFPEAGDHGPTIIPANIMFVTEERPHETFRREGNDLIMQANITLLEALTGFTLTINTLDDRKLRVAITEIVHPQYVKIVEGEGMPIMEDPKNQRGNLQIYFSIEFPKYLPRSSKLLIHKAWQTAVRGEPDDIHRIVMKDKMHRIKEKLPPE